MWAVYITSMANWLLQDLAPLALATTTADMSLCPSATQSCLEPCDKKCSVMYMQDQINLYRSPCVQKEKLSCGSCRWTWAGQKPVPLKWGGHTTGAPELVWQVRHPPDQSWSPKSGNKHAFCNKRKFAIDAFWNKRTKGGNIRAWAFTVSTEVH